MTSEEVQRFVYIHPSALNFLTLVLRVSILAPQALTLSKGALFTGEICFYFQETKEGQVPFWHWLLFK